MTNVVHSFPFPVLDEGNLSFPSGYYDVSAQTITSTSVKITHKLENAGLIERLLNNNEAKYGCLLAVPITGHRSLSLSTEAVQTVKWDIGIVGEPPIIRPIIVTTKQIECELTSDDDVADVLIGKKIQIPKGARLARGKYLRSISSLESLLDINKDEDLPDGCFVVEASENDGYRFRVNVAPDIFDFISIPRPNDPLYRSIGAHMASRCFEILGTEQGYEGEEAPDNDNGEQKWAEHSNLVMLSDLLRERGLPHWSDDNFKPEEVALQLYPLILPKTTEDE